MRPEETHPIIEQKIAAESSRSHFQPIFFYDFSRCLECKHKLKSPWRKVSPLKCAALNAEWPKCHPALSGPTEHGWTYRAKGSNGGTGTAADRKTSHILP